MKEIRINGVMVHKAEQMVSDHDCRWTFSVGEDFLAETYEMMKCKRDGILVDLIVRHPSQEKMSYP
jgi:hypothetical protein